MTNGTIKITLKIHVYKE